MKTLLRFILTLLGIAILILGYFGLIPGIKTVSAKDLGITYTQSTSDTARTQTGITFGLLPPTEGPEGSIAFRGERAIETSLSGAELSALLAYDPWKYNWAKEPQIKIHNDGTIELSGYFNTDRYAGFLEAHGNRDTPTARTILQYAPYFPTEVPLYIKGTASWKDNMLSMDLQDVQIGRVTLRPEWIEKGEAQFTRDVEAHVINVPSVYVEELSFSNGSMHFKGSMPNEIKWAAE